MPDVSADRGDESSLDGDNTIMVAETPDIPLSEFDRRFAVRKRLGKVQTLMSRSRHIDHTDLQSIPGVGKSIAQDLIDLGYRGPSDLRGEDPERMYESLCRLRGIRIDRCMLYTFRCAIYFVDNANHDPELLKWWNWKDSDDSESRSQSKTSGRSTA